MQLRTDFSVNPYNLHFKPINPSDFKYLIYLQIKEGSHGICDFIDSVIEPIGKVVRRHIGLGMDHHRIMFLVETKLKQFALNGWVELQCISL